MIYIVINDWSSSKDFSVKLVDITNKWEGE